MAAKLRAQPGEWFLIATGEQCQAHVLNQTAYRIRLNYEDGKGMVDFAADEHGRFEAWATADQNRPDPVAPVEIRARYVLTEPEEQVSAG